MAVVSYLPRHAPTCLSVRAPMHTNANDVSPRRGEILRVLREAGTSLQIREIVKRTGLDYNNVRSALSEMTTLNLLVRVNRGVYDLPGRVSRLEDSEGSHPFHKILLNQQILKVLLNIVITNKALMETLLLGQQEIIQTIRTLTPSTGEGQEAVENGCTEMHIVGGLHHQKKYDWYVHIVKLLHDVHRERMTFREIEGGVELPVQYAPGAYVAGRERTLTSVTSNTRADGEELLRLAPRLGVTATVSRGASNGAWPKWIQVSGRVKRLAGQRAIPDDLPVLARIGPIAGDNRQHIQTAINFVAAQLIIADDVLAQYLQHRPTIDDYAAATWLGGCRGWAPPARRAARPTW